MDDAQVYAGCTRLRREIADWLDGLEPEQLTTRSLCTEWTVADVAGHLESAVTEKPWRLLVLAVRSGFDLNRANTAMARAHGSQPIGQVTGRLRERADVRLKYPGVGVHGPLLDLLVHSGDMRLPLGQPMAHEPELTIEAMDKLSRGLPGLVPRKRLAGLRLVATDERRAWLAGAEVLGSLNDLLLAVTGRRATLERLSGPGLAILESRL